MIVIIVDKLGNGDVSKKFGGIACDVEGCEAYEPQSAEGRKNLAQLGWFIAPGRHRCPEHHDVDVPAREPQHCGQELATKRL